MWGSRAGPNQAFPGFLLGGQGSRWTPPQRFPSPGLLTHTHAQGPIPASLAGLVCLAQPCTALTPLFSPCPEVSGTVGEPLPGSTELDRQKGLEGGRGTVQSGGQHQSGLRGQPAWASYQGPQHAHHGLTGPGALGSKYRVVLPAGPGSPREGVIVAAGGRCPAAH
jgi:hypothetical protein